MIGKAALTLFLIGSAAPAIANARDPACVRANDGVTQYRLGHDRAGRASATDPQRAVAIGSAVEARCTQDMQFVFALALARIDVAKQAGDVAVDKRAAAFDRAMADLERVRAAVASGQSDQYGIFATLGYIYYGTQQYQKSIDVLNASAPVFDKQKRKTQQSIFFMRGMSALKLSQFTLAERSFHYAKKFGHPDADRWLGIVARAAQ